MGLYHSVGLGYGFEIPADTDIDAVDRALFGQPDSPDSVGYIVVGDRDRLLLVTRHVQALENTVTPVDGLATVDEMTAWNEALHAAAVRLQQSAHPMPAWLLIHNYR
ncbi:hypothetical protein [Streptomyces turgidiscabies]|uniref:hypothetical protein n=1 Tax=Streptomyces turgidiscabies TaxID=85558 RepID=UPI0038F7F5F5